MNYNVLSCSFDYIPEIEYVSPHGIQMSLLSNINNELTTHYLIYKIYNLVNGKYYVGQHRTENPYDYYMGSGDIINEAIEKYGISCFVKTILFDYDNFDDMNNKEAELVQLSNCTPYDPMSYNIRAGGNNGKINQSMVDKMLQTRIDRDISFKKEKNPMFGISPKERMSDSVYKGWLENKKNYKPAEETKKAISKSLTGRKFSKEHREKIKLGNIGKKKNLTEEQRKNLSLRAKLMFTGKNKTDEHKKKIGLGNKGKKRSDEVKQRLHEVNLGKHISEETRKKMSQAGKGRIFSDEHRQKISQNNVMHTHSVTDFMTDDEIRLWKQHIAESSRGRRKMYNPITDHVVSVKSDQFQRYLDLGYHFGSRPRKVKPNNE